MPDTEPSSVDRWYEQGLVLARAGRWFEAHEEFELAWRACDPAERDFFQGLVHVVVATYQRERGRPVAADSQRAKALRRLAPFAPVHRGIDVAALLGSLERVEPDPREHLVDRHAEPPVAVEEEKQAEDDQGHA